MESQSGDDLLVKEATLVLFFIIGKGMPGIGRNETMQIIYPTMPTNINSLLSSNFLQTGPTDR